MSTTSLTIYLNLIIELISKTLFINTELYYDEAQELASAGSSVLHPRCISPVRNHGIPLFIRSTTSPEIPGTVVSSVTVESEPQVKGICLRNGLTLISMDSVGIDRKSVV